MPLPDKSQLEFPNESRNILTIREMQEIQFCLTYAEQFNHGAPGHNRMMLIAKLARELGYTIEDNN